MNWMQEAVDKLTGYEAQKQAAETLPPGREQMEARLWVEIVEGGFSILDDEDRLVLELLFIHKVKRRVDLLCDLLGASKSAVYARRDKALRRFTMALYGASEST